MKTFQEFINEESVEDVEDFSQLVNQAKVDKLSKEEIEAVLKKAGAKKEIIVDLLQKYTTNATNEGALEDVKTKQAAYKAESKIPGVWFETGWTHQNYKFYIMFDGYKTPEVENILNQFIKDEKSFNKDGEFHLSATRTSANPYLMFEKTNKYSKALCEELADSITGYSQEDL